MQTLRHIVLPLIAPAIVAGALLSVTLSIDEFVVTFFTIGPQLTLPLYIITQIKFGVTPEVNALATVILVRHAGRLRGRLAPAQSRPPVPAQRTGMTAFSPAAQASVHARVHASVRSDR